MRAAPPPSLRRTGLCRPVASLLALGLLFLCPHVAVRAQAPSLSAVLARAGAYVERYQQEFALLLTDERYVQVEGPIGRQSGPPWPIETVTGAEQERHLRSEFALVRTEDAHGPTWTAFRDVLEVDGQPVGDHEGRLERLFLDRAPGTLARAEAIALESARYNIGGVSRTVNVPTLALDLLARSRQARMRCRKLDEEIVAGVSAWKIECREREAPTLIRTPDGKDIFTRALFWIEPAEGRVVRTELHPDAGEGLRTQITVAYAPDTRLDLWVPVEMTELYVSGSTQTTGVASYSNFRRFETGARLKDGG